MAPTNYTRHLYAREKFGLAVHKLATGEGDVRKRLIIAFREIWHLEPTAVPKHLVRDLSWIKRQMTRLGPLRDENGEVWRRAVEHTMSRIRNSTGAKIAERIYRVNSKLDWLAHHKRK